MARPLTVVLDTETTGLGRAAWREDGIVQVALAYRDPETGSVRTWSETCNPGRHLYADGRAAGAFAVNGLTEAQVLAARPVLAVAETLRGHLVDLQRRHGALDLRAYNLRFDQPFLAAAPWSLVGPWGPCLMLEAHAILSPRGKWPKLTFACEALGLAYPGKTHEAAADAHAALLVHQTLEARRLAAASAASVPPSS